MDFLSMRFVDLISKGDTRMLRELKPITMEHLCNRLKFYERFKNSKYNTTNKVDEKIKDTKEQIVDMAMQQYS